MTISVGLGQISAAAPTATDSPPATNITHVGISVGRAARPPSSNGVSSEPAAIMLLLVFSGRRASRRAG